MSDIQSAALGFFFVRNRGTVLLSPPIRSKMVSGDKRTVPLSPFTIEYKSIGLLETLSVQNDLHII